MRKEINATLFFVKVLIITNADAYHKICDTYQTNDKIPTLIIQKIWHTNYIMFKCIIQQSEKIIWADTSSSHWVESFSFTGWPVILITII